MAKHWRNIIERCEKIPIMEKNKNDEYSYLIQIIWTIKHC